MLQLMSPMSCLHSARRTNYVYTVGVFAAVCVVADLLVSGLSHLSDAQVQMTLFAVVLSGCAFAAGSWNAGRKSTRAKLAPAKKSTVPAKKFVRSKGVARQGDHEARQAAKKSIQATGVAPVAPPVQAAQTAEPQPAEPQPAEPEPAAPQPAGPQPAAPQAAEPQAAEPQPAEPAVECGARQADQIAGPQPELPRQALKAPRYASRSSTDAQVPAECEGTLDGRLDAEKTGQSTLGARVIEPTQKQGVDPCTLDMDVCVRNNDAATALKLFDHIRKRDLACEHTPTAVPEATRISFFTLVAEQFGDEQLRKGGLQILAAVQAHGVQPPQILQNRLICAWGGTLPEQVLDYFVEMREEGIALSSAACRCIMADVVGSTGGKACSPPVDAATSQDDSVRDGAEEDPDVARHAATERTSLRREASTFVPKCLEGPWQVQPEESTVCSWVPRPPPGLCDEFPQVDTQQMGYQYDDGTTIILRNLPCPFLRDNLIALMDAKGFAGFYDFVYLPVDFKTGMGLGYAFVNILTEEVRRFALAFDGFKDWPRYASGADLSRPRVSAKICAVDMSRTQGLFANVERYRNSPLMSDEVPDRFRPVLFNGTERVPFPEPTRELPRVLHKSIEW
ncbi:unnamed protein product [Prorocentrum cordatum]|uniref:Mei2-like C-terminal RNA recognition motif domain-containing protein n=1 Tax=Prorocentrum cordatum TaxID=2364126 RepID=A0ABN9TB01_9DINO|nr:unnamed protein product [Polarella glacialis]